MPAQLNRKEYSKGYYEKNKSYILSRNKEYKKRWKANNPEKLKEQWTRHHLNKKLRDRGITIDQYNDIKDNSGGVCAICGSEGKNGLHLDHCHSTNTVRGLLCCRCNLGLGYFSDNPAVLAAAIEYLVPK